MAVKMIKVGTRDCILVREHCVPFDMVARIQFVDLPEPPKTPAEQAMAEINPLDPGHARIYTASEPEGIRLDGTEAKQLRKLLNNF